MLHERPEKVQVRDENNCLQMHFLQRFQIYNFTPTEITETNRWDGAAGTQGRFFDNSFKDEMGCPSGSELSTPVGIQVET